MRALLIRLLFVLISANVAYGTGGDFYAEEVQALVNPSRQQKFEYKPQINSELFYATKQQQVKQSNTILPGNGSLSGSRGYCTWQVRAQLFLGDLLYNIYQQHSSPIFKIKQTKHTLFPRHFFF